MKICQKQKQKCKKQLWKRKGCFVGLGRLPPSALSKEKTFKSESKNFRTKCKKQLWNGKVAWQGQAGCSPSARPLLRSIKSDKMTFIALLYSPFSALQFAFYFTFLIFSSKTAFSCLLSDSRAQYLCNVQRGGAVGIFFRVGCCWILSGHRLIRTTLYILSLSRPYFLKQASLLLEQVWED